MGKIRDRDQNGNGPQRHPLDAAEEAAFFEYETIACNGYCKMCNGNVTHLMRPKRRPFLSMQR